MVDKEKQLEQIHHRVSGQIMDQLQSFRESPYQREILYTTMEVLPGRTLSNNIMNLRQAAELEKELKLYGLTMDELENKERDPSLGNGGLGRLAACMIESASTKRIPLTVSVLRFRNGLFRQTIHNGRQVEEPDLWTDENGHYRFEIPFPSAKQEVVFQEPGGKVTVDMIPCDIPVRGRGGYCNFIRAWKVGKVHSQLNEEQEAMYHELDGALYPNDSTEQGKWLRLAQEYALSAATVGSALKKCEIRGWDVRTLPDHFCLHINDTHAVLMIPECMRLLMERYHCSYEEAWQITQKTFVYTNHTILAEALETWPISLMEAKLPKVYAVIHQMHDRFKTEILQRYAPSVREEKLKKMAILYDGSVHMARLAIYASYSVNGVARIHTDILCKRELRDFYEHMPEKFTNVTNGVTQRKFLHHANPQLSYMLSTVLEGDDWITHWPQMQRLMPMIKEHGIHYGFMKAHWHCKKRLAKLIKEQRGIDVPTQMIFDVHVKRFHEYKRQQLNCLRIISLYQQLKENPDLPMSPTAFIFAGKAAASYKQAKLVIELIHALERKINDDPDVNDKMRVVFIEDFNVTKAEWIYAAADVSEQISTASKEASGTGNMKFMMNGAVTMGTLDGANVEICEAVGRENMFLFGMTADQVMALEATPWKYDPQEELRRDHRLYQAVDALRNGTFQRIDPPAGEPDTFVDLVNEWLYGQNGNPPDRYFVLKDFGSYMDAFFAMNQAYEDMDRWNQMCLTNIACSGRFSSDRMVDEYMERVWKLT